MAGRLQKRVVALAFTLMACAAHAQAPAYPAKPVRVIVSVAAGASADIVTRIITPKLSEALGQQFVVDNRVGASGNIGAEMGARAAPDGHTLLVAYAGNAIYQTIGAKLNYSLEKDFEPVGLVGALPLALVVHPSIPAKNVKELVALVKARPGQLYFASPGTASLPHLAAELFKVQSGIDIIHVPYKGTTQAVTDVAAGQVAMTFAAPLSALPHVQSGRLRMLAISSIKRSANAPDLPTMSESGLKGYDVTQWYGVLAPAGTSQDIVVRLNKALSDAVRMPDVREKFASGGVDPMTSTPAELAAYIKAEIAKWAKTVKASGARFD
ncbi:MAG: tripartite tricarboxylate transporter substrate binding protein [Burkholderiales bacterium]